MSRCWLPRRSALLGAELNVCVQLDTADDAKNYLERLRNNQCWTPPTACNNGALLTNLIMTLLLHYERRDATDALTRYPRASGVLTLRENLWDEEPKTWLVHNDMFGKTFGSVSHDSRMQHPNRKQVHSRSGRQIPRNA